MVDYVNSDDTIGEERREVFVEEIRWWKKRLEIEEKDQTEGKSGEN